MYCEYRECYMAALILHACSILEQVFRVGCVLVRTKGSLYDCWHFIVAERRQFLINNYLKEISENSTLLLPPAKHNMNEDEDILEFVHIETPAAYDLYKVSIPKYTHRYKIKRCTTL